MKCAFAVATGEQDRPAGGVPEWSTTDLVYNGPGLQRTWSTTDLVQRRLHPTPIRPGMEGGVPGVVSQRPFHRTVYICVYICTRISRSDWADGDPTLPKKFKHFLSVLFMDATRQRETTGGGGRPTMHLRERPHPPAVQSH